MTGYPGALAGCGGVKASYLADRVGRVAPDALKGRRVLSLFDYSGNWPHPYRMAGAEVIQVDLKHGWDIMTMDEGVLEGLRPVHGVMAAPPCTDFAVSGAQYWGAKDADGRTARSVELVRRVLRIVEYLKPDWWVLENPVGRLNRVVPELGKWGPVYFDPYEFGDAYTKRTGLWGRFVMPDALLLGYQVGVEPERVSKQGSWVQRLGGKSERTKELRSMTPMGFARAFFLVNCWGAA